MFKKLKVSKISKSDFVLEESPFQSEELSLPLISTNS